MGRKLREGGTRVVPSKFAHFVLRTRRYREMIDWWRTVLLAEPVFENDFLCFLTYDDEHHRLAIANAPNLPEAPEGAVGVDHVAYTYESMADLLFTYRRLKAAGIEPVWCINHGPTTSLYYRDPDGTRAELQIDNFPDEESLKAWFASGAFEKNPIGVEFDPEKLLARWEQGVPESELIQQGSA